MKRINCEKLIAAYEEDAKALEFHIDGAEAEIRERLSPYLQSGIFTEEDILPLTDKLVEASRAEFDKKWATVETFIEEDDPARLDDVEVNAPAPILFCRPKTWTLVSPIRAIRKNLYKEKKL